MIKAYPIDAKGVRIGAERTFSDLQWAKMQNHNGKNLRWVQISSEEQKPITTKKAERRKKHEE